VNIKEVVGVTDKAMNNVKNAAETIGFSVSDTDTELVKHRNAANDLGYNVQANLVIDKYRKQRLLDMGLMPVSIRDAVRLLNPSGILMNFGGQVYKLGRLRILLAIIMPMLHFLEIKFMVSASLNVTSPNVPMENYLALILIIIAVMPILLGIIFYAAISISYDMRPQDVYTVTSAETFGGMLPKDVLLRIGMLNSARAFDNFKVVAPSNAWKKTTNVILLGSLGNMLNEEYFFVASCESTT
jgi:hypothetical protein